MDALDDKLVRDRPGRLSLGGPVILTVLVVALYFLATRPVAPPAGWETDYDVAVARASTEGRKLLVGFYMNGCPPCMAMDRTVLRNDAVKRALVDYVAVRVDIDQRRELANRYAVFATPTYAVLDAKGQLLARSEGFSPTDEFVRFLGRAAALGITPSDYHSRHGQGAR